MPALQVRDFPIELYEELREFAEQNHRSMSQQVVVAVEQMIHGTPENTTALRESGSNSLCGECVNDTSHESLIDQEHPVMHPVQYRHRPRISSNSVIKDSYSQAEREARIRKRRELFAYIEETAKDLPPDLPDPVEMVRESRREREEHLMAVLLENGIGVEK